MRNFVVFSNYNIFINVCFGRGHVSLPAIHELQTPFLQPRTLLDSREVDTGYPLYHHCHIRYDMLWKRCKPYMQWLEKNFPMILPAPSAFETLHWCLFCRNGTCLSFVPTSI